MPNTQQIISERLDLLTPEYRDFLRSGHTEIVSEMYGSELGMDEDDILVLENGLVLFLLLLLNKEGLVAYIQSECMLDRAAASSLTDALLETFPPSMLYEINKLEAGNPSTQPNHQSASAETLTSRGVEKLQSLGQNYNKYSTSAAAAISSVAPVTPPQPTIPPVVPQTSVAAHITDMPIAQPRSSAQLDMMPPLIPESHFQPVVAAPAQTVPQPVANAPTPPLPPKDVQPVNTMGTDIERIHGYGAYRDQYPHLYGDEAKNKEAIRSVAQDALLKRAPVVETPDFSGPSNL